MKILFAIVISALLMSEALSLYVIKPCTSDFGCYFSECCATLQASGDLKAMEAASGFPV